MRFAITDRRVVCRSFGFVVVAVFAVAVLTCRRFDRVPNFDTSYATPR